MKHGDYLKTADRALSAVENFFAVLAGFGIALLMALFSIDAVLRYAFSAAIAIKYELTELVLMPGLVALSISWVYRHRGHVALTIFYEVLPRVWQTSITLVHNLLILAFSALITWFTFGKALEAFQENLVVVGEIGWKLWLCWSPLPLGLAVLTLRVALETAKLARGEANDDTLSDARAP